MFLWLIQLHFYEVSFSDVPHFGWVIKVQMVYVTALRDINNDTLQTVPIKINMFAIKRTSLLWR